MEILSGVPTLSWQAVVAVIGSVVAIVTGYFGYLIKVRTTPPTKSTADEIDDAFHQFTAINKLNLLGEKVADIEADAKIMDYKLLTLTTRFNAHEDRNEYDFKQLNIKVDKLTDIVLAVLSSDEDRSRD